jgi:GGDEF domain-containing protein
MAEDPELPAWRKVSAAVGIAAYDPVRDESADDVLKRADAAMYEEKKAMKAERRD